MGGDLAGKLEKEKHKVALVDLSSETISETFSRLKQEGFFPDRIVYLSALEKNFNPDTAPDDYHKLLEIARQTEKQKTLLINVTNNLFDIGANAQINLLHSFSRGAVKNIPLEFSHITCLHLDILKSAKPMETELITTQLFEELQRKEAPSPNEDTIAYRAFKRLTLKYKPVNADYTQKGRAMIKTGGTYLVTGALGGIGYTLAKELASHYSPGLILLTGRSPFPREEDWNLLLQGNDETVKKKIQKILELKKLGANVLPIGGDFSRQEEVQQLIKEAANRFSGIDGIIHCAGVPDGRMIQKRTPETDIPLMAPKVQGSLFLTELSKNFSLDFFVNCSSLSSVCGTLGQTGYSAANAFQDSLAEYYRQKHHLNVITINWGTWNESGMASSLQKRLEEMRGNLKSAKNKQIVKTYLNHGITPTEGIECFYNILGMNTARAIVSTLPLEGEGTKALNKELYLLLREGEGDNQTLNKEKSPLRAFNNLDEIMEECRYIWSKHLGMENIKINDNYFNLGGDSLEALEIVPNINKTFGTDFSTSNFLELDTIKLLAEGVNEKINGNTKKSIALPESIITLKKSASPKPPLFLVHLVSGTVYFYRQLTSSLQEDRMVYGIQARGLEDGSFIHDLKEMAALYVKNIMKVQPEGPYYIGGSSMGGCLAYEMALQLIQKGKEIGGIIMLDTPGPGAKVPSFKDHEEVMAYFLSYNTEHNNTETLAKLYTLPGDMKYNYFLQQQAIYNQLLKKNENRLNLKRSIEITMINSRAMENYYNNLKGLFPGKVLFFSATQESQLPTRLEEGWKNFISGKLEVHKIEGNHITINFDPYAKRIAPIIEEFINENS